jgi:hypothetical protein
MTTKKQQKNIILSTLKGLMGETYGTKLFNWLTSVNDGFLKTATGLTTTAQNVTDNEGTATTLYLSKNSITAMSVGSDGSTIFGENSGQAANNYCVAVGKDCLIVSTGWENVAIGYNILPKLLYAHNNIAIGVNAMLESLTSNSNIAMGANSMAAGTTGDENIYLGKNSGHRNDGANYNIGLGFRANYGDSLYTGEKNIVMGYYANNNNAGGDSNILIGNSTYKSASTASNELNIGNALYAININNGGSGTPGADPQFAIGKVTPDASAILDLNSTTTRGVIPPNLTTVQRNAIVSPADTLLVFDTDLDTLCFYSVTLAGWRQVSHSAA